MTGTKSNERPGTRAQVRYLRMSASKARVVLDLIRDKHVVEASEILAFSERLAAKEIQKVLRSAVANAAHNDEIPAEELYVSACYADEGPTLKRFRPRARGRAGRIHKQTCHITVIVSRLSDEKLDHMRNRAERRGQGQTAGASRAARVAKSRGASAGEQSNDEDATVADVADEKAGLDEVAGAETTAVETTAVETTAVETTAVETTAVDEAVTDEGEAVDEAATDEVVDVEEAAADEVVVEPTASDEATTEETNNDETDDSGADA